jgi:hypothetical protein
VVLSLPAFNLLVDKKLFIDFHDINFWITGCGFILMTGIMAGSYPAFIYRPSILSKFKICCECRKTGRQPAKIPRRGAVYLAIILIISTFIVLKQIRYAQNRDAGYDKDNLVYSYMQGDLQKNYELIRNELLSKGIAMNVNRTSGPMTRHWSDTGDFNGLDPPMRT